MPRKAMTVNAPTRRSLNTKEAAVHLALTPRAFYERAAQRKVPYARLGGSLRFDKCELDWLLERNVINPQMAENPLDIVLRARGPPIAGSFKSDKTCIGALLTRERVRWQDRWSLGQGVA